MSSRSRSSVRKRPLRIQVAGYCFEHLLLKPGHSDFAAVRLAGGADLLYEMVKASRGALATKRAAHLYSSVFKRRLVLQLGKCKLIRGRPTDDGKPIETIGVREVLGWCDCESNTVANALTKQRQFLLLTCDKPLGCGDGSTFRMPRSKPKCCVVLTHDPRKLENERPNVPKEMSPEDVIVITSAREFRLMGSACRLNDLSWEGALDDFRQSILHSRPKPLDRMSEWASHFVIGLGPDAAIYVNWGKEKIDVYLACIPHLAYTGRENNATSFIFCELLAAGMSLSLSRSSDVKTALRYGVEYSSSLSDSTLISYANSYSAAGRHVRKSEWFDGPQNSADESEARSPWSLLGDRCSRRGGGNRPTRGARALATLIVKHGLPRTAVRHKFLFARIGGWLGVDRQEIEGYQSIRRLMTEYLEDTSFARPLCLATFGPPGSGKSRGVKELTKSLFNAGLKIDEKPLEFNMAEYKDSSGLASALHKVRDRALTGKVPVAMFDEFDSALEGAELGWLKYFLAPMQDGTFREGDSVYHTGRAIFVFAGGTRRSFDDFAGQMRNAWFIGAKGPDFVSRLRGHVNVAGLGSVDDDDEQQKAMNIVRKAVFLRTFLQIRLGKKEDEQIEVEPAVCRALLCNADYRHGVRSMEAIIGMCARVPHGQMLTRSMLPPRDQLDMHLDAANFLKAIEEPR